MRETSVPFNTPKLVLTKGLKKKKITKPSKPIHPTQAIHSHQPNQSMRHEKKSYLAITFSIYRQRRTGCQVSLWFSTMLILKTVH